MYKNILNYNMKIYYLMLSANSSKLLRFSIELTIFNTPSSLILL